jgi:hypothetical protein
MQRAGARGLDRRMGEETVERDEVARALPRRVGVGDVLGEDALPLIEIAEPELRQIEEVGHRLCP